MAIAAIERRPIAEATPRRMAYTIWIPWFLSAKDLPLTVMRAISSLPSGQR